MRGLNFWMQAVNKMNDRLLSVLEDIAINLERIAEALEDLAEK